MSEQCLDSTGTAMQQAFPVSLAKPALKDLEQPPDVTYNNWPLDKAASPSASRPHPRLAYARTSSDSAVRASCRSWDVPRKRRLQLLSLVRKSMWRLGVAE